MRFLRATLLGLAAVLLAAALALAVECPGCGKTVPDGTKVCPKCGTKLPVTKPEPKKPEPRKPEPRKPEPRKPDPRVAAKKAYVAAERAWKADPRNYDAAIKGFGAVRKSAAGTGYDMKAAKMVATLKKLKEQAAAAASLQAARDAYLAAEKAWKGSPRDYDAAIKGFTAARKAAAGTAYEPKAAARIAKLEALKARAAPKTPGPKKPEPKKPEPKKPDPRVAARKAYVEAEKAWKAKPQDYDAAIKGFTAVKKSAAGTGYETKAEKMITRLTALKAEAAAAAGLQAARDAYLAAEKAWKTRPQDYDAAIKGFTAVKKSAAGTGYDMKAAKMIAKLEKAKARAEPKKPEPKKPEPKKPEPKKAKPITDFAAKPAGDVTTPAAAWVKAQEVEKAPGRGARARAEAALPYYLATVTLKNADGSRDENAAAAALRLGELIEKYAAGDGERLSAGKYYMASAGLALGSPAWKSAEKLYIKAGQGALFARLLAGLGQRAEAAGMKKFAAGVKRRAAALAAKYGE